MHMDGFLTFKINIRPFSIEKIGMYLLEYDRNIIILGFTPAQKMIYACFCVRINLERLLRYIF